mgnify:CR=1 FL=1
MMKIYKTLDEQGFFREQTKLEKGCWINLINPTAQEINTLCNSIGVREEFIRYPLDQEEKARIDVEDDQTLIVIDLPTVEKNDGEIEGFTTIPIGMIVVRDDYFITVCTAESPILREFIDCRVKGFFTFKKTRFILQILYKTAVYYLNYLKFINRETDKAENRLQKSMRNQELIRLLELEKSLVYFTTSLKSNEIVMEKLMRSKFIKMYEEDEDILEDAITENRQAIEMAKIYSDILNGSMEAYGSIISNNLNGVMKTLTSITIVLAVPTMISSFWGMNVSLPFEHSPFGFAIMIIIALLTTILVTWWLKKKDMFN